MLHFNQRSWFRMFPDDIAADSGAVAVPVPSTGGEAGSAVADADSEIAP